MSATLAIDDVDRPFSWHLNELHLTYAALEQRCKRVRSVSWFHKLLTHADPWTQNPPTRDTFEALASLLDVSVSTVKVWIAKEWYGVRNEEAISDRVKAMAYRIDRLPAKDVPAIAELIKHLGGPDEFDDI
jgi:hypothetical protein